ncbi:S-layer homology domain-containing protein [Paenibacillus sedimenti]|uniref:S-layer homology domain-containing protein n=1 Tax=Paenibacillus sedimenti TaxID=2770274 RepID=A0A926KM22_9BACL|nr:S-layer homology domain-containing protein [Paenibacillus sedimenti]MBD0379623.1 S-layer homology domain-containing protein [Paenibacillus sedimenti]
MVRVNIGSMHFWWIALVILIMACFISTTVYAAPAAEIATDKRTYKAGDTVEITVKLDGFTSGAQINSATLRLAYDSSTFELLTNQVNNDVVDGGIPSAAKTDSAVPGTITYLVASPSINYPVVNDQAVFTVKMKVKSNAAVGDKTFFLKGDNQDLSTDLLDLDDHVYHLPSTTATVTIASSSSGGAVVPFFPIVLPAIEIPSVLMPDVVLTGGLPFVSLNEAVKAQRTDSGYEVQLDPSIAAGLINETQGDNGRLLSFGIDVRGAASFEIPSSVAKLAVERFGEEGAIMAFTRAGSFTVPLSVIKVNDGFAEGAAIHVSILPLSQENLAKVKEAADQDEESLLPAAGVTYHLSISAGGQERTINDFGNTFTVRSIGLGEIKANLSTDSVFMLYEGRLQPVPTQLVTGAGGAMQAIFRRTGNSTYVVGHKSIDYGDLAGHWAQTAINKLSAKGYVNGKSASSFKPDDPVTRAEFAALLIRGLALYDKQAAGFFSDVKETDWFRKDVFIANRAGLVTGYSGKFHPHERITRQEMAVMAARALLYANPGKESGSADIARFADAEEISGWAEEAIRITVANGIMNGPGHDRFDPRSTSTRAQAALVLLKLLQSLEFID